MIKKLFYGYRYEYSQFIINSSLSMAILLIDNIYLILLILKFEAIIHL